MQGKHLILQSQKIVVILINRQFKSHLNEMAISTPGQSRREHQSEGKLKNAKVKG